MAFQCASQQSMCKCIIQSIQQVSSEYKNARTFSPKRARPGQIRQPWNSHHQVFLNLTSVNLCQNLTLVLTTKRVPVSVIPENRFFHSHLEVRLMASFLFQNHVLESGFRVWFYFKVSDMMNHLSLKMSLRRICWFIFHEEDDDDEPYQRVVVVVHSLCLFLLTTTLHVQGNGADRLI